MKKFIVYGAIALVTFAANAAAITVEEVDRMCDNIKMVSGLAYDAAERDISEEVTTLFFLDKADISDPQAVGILKFAISAGYDGQRKKRSKEFTEDMVRLTCISEVMKFLK